MPPVWVAGLDWTRALDHDTRTITRVTPWGTRFDGWDTIPDRLDWLMQQKPRPQDADTVTEWASALERHADTAATLLDPVIMEVDAPCPECQQKTVTLPDNDGNPVEHRTLRFRTESADCRACGTLWRGMDIIELAHAANNPPPKQPEEL